VNALELFGVAQAWASAAGADHHAPSIHDIWFPLANFLIFAFIIVRYALPPIRNFLRSRHGEVLASLQEAATKKRQVEEMIQDYQGRLAHLEQEVQSIQASLRTEGEREKTKLLSETQILAAKIKQDAQFLAEQEVKMARQKIRQEIADQAESIARELVLRHLSSSDQSRLVQDFVRSIGQVR
jgi:F-type H+-transporting ATPase subunit b